MKNGARSASKQLVTFPNPNPERDYVIRHVCPEYTAVCPVTGQPDFGTIVVIYVPDRLCVELKSLKLYLWSFRDEGHYFEQATNQILDDLARSGLAILLISSELPEVMNLSTRAIPAHAASRPREKFSA